MAHEDFVQWDRKVKISPSYLLQGMEREGEYREHDASGITIKERGANVFYPWSSVGYVVWNPAEQKDEAF